MISAKLVRAAGATAGVITIAALSAPALSAATNGPAVSAGHHRRHHHHAYLIESLSQINPAVQRLLREAVGSTGKTGGESGTLARGPIGPTGATGATGPEGPSAVYEIALSKSSPETEVNKARVLTLAHLPAGAYAISAKATISPTGGALGLAQCQLKAGSASDYAYERLALEAGFPVSVDNELTAQLSAEGGVTLTCSVSAAKWTLLAGKEGGTRIVAVKVASQHAETTEETVETPAEVLSETTSTSTTST